MNYLDYKVYENGDIGECLIDSDDETDNL